MSKVNYEPFTDVSHTCNKCGHEEKYQVQNWGAMQYRRTVSKRGVCPKCYEDFIFENCGEMLPTTGER